MTAETAAWQERDGVLIFRSASEDLWSGTVSAPDPGRAWVFNAGSGAQIDFDHSHPMLAAAVRPGDVAPAMPEPQTYALLLMGLGALLLVQRRRLR